MLYDVAGKLTGILLLGRKNAVKSVNVPKPVQLPSYKKESKGFDSTVSIVPHGSQGWRVDTQNSSININNNNNISNVSTSQSITQQPQLQSNDVRNTAQSITPTPQSSRWSAPAVPQPIKFSKPNVSPSPTDSNDGRYSENDDKKSSTTTIQPQLHPTTQSHRYDTPHDSNDEADEMANDSRRRRTSGNQWDESDEEMVCYNVSI